jgi:hypothetical protein
VSAALRSTEFKRGRYYYRLVRRGVSVVGDS